MVKICECRGGRSFIDKARTPPAVHPGMTIWGVNGGSPPSFFWLNLIFFCDLERQIQNRRQTPSGRKVCGRKEERRRIMPSLVATTSSLARTHNVRTHSLRSHQKVLVDLWFGTVSNLVTD